MILLMAVVVVFAAGTTLGVWLTRSYALAEGRGAGLARELGLSPAQREQMEKIWSEQAGPVFRQIGARRGDAAQQRDQQIRDLLSDEQRARYDAIQQDYSHTLDQLSEDRKKAFDEAVKSTEAILTSEQVAKYEDMLSRRRDRGGRGGHRWQSTTSSRPTSSNTSVPHVGEQQ
jgi:Spy/CpxP family protein refolding chaperone